MSLPLPRAAGAAAFALAAAPALAGGLAAPVATPVPAAPVTVVTPVATPSADWSGFYLGGQVSGGSFDLGDGLEGSDGTLYGVHLGYQRDLGRLVVGAEAAYDTSNDLTLGDGGPDVDSLTRASVRVGYDGGRFLPYATVGYEQADVAGVEGTTDGYVYGLGAEFAVTDSISVGGEFLQHELGEVGDGGPDASLSTIGLRASYRF